MLKVIYFPLFHLPSLEAVDYISYFGIFAFVCFLFLVINLTCLKCSLDHNFFNEIIQHISSKQEKFYFTH